MDNAIEGPHATHSGSWPSDCNYQEARRRDLNRVCVWAWQEYLGRIIHFTFIITEMLSELPITSTTDDG